MISHKKFLLLDNPESTKYHINILLKPHILKDNLYEVYCIECIKLHRRVFLDKNVFSVKNVPLSKILH